MTERVSEKGSVFLYIFIAAALLGALSFAVAQGGRSSIKNFTDDQQRLLATEIIDYSEVVAKAVTQLRLRGTQITELSFANPFLSASDYGSYNSDPANEIFNPTGGAVVYKSPSPDATTTGTEEFMFLADNVVDNIGTTCTGAACSDLIMAIPNVREQICTTINDLLGVPNPSDAPPTDSNIDEAGTFEPNANPFGYSQTIGDESTALQGQAEACFEETDDSEFVYYKVLLPR